MEGYFFYRALITVFETDRLKTIHHYLIGYGCPVLVIIATVSVTLSGHEVNQPQATLVLKHYQAKKNGPLMGQVFLDLSDPGGGGMGWQNLRKWEKS